MDSYSVNQYASRQTVLALTFVAAVLIPTAIDGPMADITLGLSPSSMRPELFTPSRDAHVSLGRLVAGLKTSEPSGSNTSRTRRAFTLRVAEAQHTGHRWARVSARLNGPLPGYKLRVNGKSISSGPTVIYERFPINERAVTQLEIEFSQAAQAGPFAFDILWTAELAS